MFKLAKISFLFLVLALSQQKVRAEGDEDENILTWKAPRVLQIKYPYYLSGLDKEGSPVWVIEFGRWNLRSTLEKGGQIVKDFEKYTEQMVRRWQASTKLYGVQKYVLIADLQDYSNRQLSYAPSVLKYLSIVRQFVDTFKDFPSLKKEYIVNSNVFFNTLWLLSRPALGQYLHLVELHDEDETKWQKVLLEKIDKDQLPKWLGGVEENFKPIRVYG